MASKINTTRLKKSLGNEVLYEVIRPQTKKLSRYKLKKQTALAQQILQEIDQV